MPTPPEEQRENNANRPGGITGRGFPPGVSGNPGGRPKGRSVAARLRELLDATELGGKPIPGGRQVADLVAEAILKAALKGDHRFVTTLLERAEGKVAEPPPEAEKPRRIEILGADGNPRRLDPGGGDPG